MEAITVKELIKELQRFDGDLPVIGKHDALTWYKAINEIYESLYTDNGGYIEPDARRLEGKPCLVI